MYNPARPFRICMILHSTRSDNLGVGALTVSEVEIVRDIARKLGLSIRITVMDWKDKRKPYVSGSDIEVRDLDGKAMINPFGYFAVARRADLVLDIGGGDSFSDIYGSRRLSRMLLLKFLTHLAGTPLVMAPQTIGPFSKWWSKILAKFSIRTARVVASRDVQSVMASRQLGVLREIIEASDVALRLPFDPPAARQPSGPTRVGVNVSGLLMAGGYTRGNELGISVDYPALMRGLIAAFLDRGTEVHLVSHVIVPDGRMAIEDDYRVAVALSEQFPGTVLAPAFTNPSEAKTYIAGMDFFIGARMHACIAAFSSGVPVVPMAYSRKFAGFFGSLGYDHTIDCTVEDEDTITRRIFSAFDRRREIASETVISARLGVEKLGRYEDALAQVISEIASTR